MNKQDQMPSFYRDIYALSEKALKEMFRNEIKPGFLIIIKNNVIRTLGNEIYYLYDFQLTSEKILTGIDNNLEYEVCKCIVGVHHSNTVFLPENECSAKEKSKEYQEHITKQVVQLIKMRLYAGQYFRNKQIMSDERYIYYPVPYLLFVMCTSSAGLIHQKPSIDYVDYYSLQIINKALSALVLLEDSLLDSAYMPCRVAIELFVKTTLLKEHSEIRPLMERLLPFVIDKNFVTQEYSDEFIELYEARTISDVSRNNYLHYGFVDAIEDYHREITDNPYSVYGILHYLEKSSADTQYETFSKLETLYKICNGFAHGNAIISRFTTLHYFELSLILGEIVPKIYLATCEELGCDKSINGIDILKLFDEEFSLLQRQYESKATALFELEKNKRLDVKKQTH